MDIEKIIVVSEKDLKRIISEVFDEKLAELYQESNFCKEETYSINQVAKMLRRSHKKISDLVRGGILKATIDNRIYEGSIKEYMECSK